MADYFPLIARAIAALDPNNGESRRALYERARTALVAQLWGVTPALSESEITRERLALEEAIRKSEAQNARIPPSTPRPTANDGPLNRAAPEVGPAREKATEPTPPMPSGKIFISYRRDDSAGHAGRVHDRLSAEFGRELLFMDVDAIPLGSDFVKVLKEEVGRCDVLLAVVGPHWLDARDKDGRRRLDDPLDFVRVEISTALQRDIPVVPILLEGVSVPKAAELPSDMRTLSSRNALNVRHASFHQDIDKLIGFLRLRQLAKE